MIELNINGRDVQVDAEPDTPLLWVLREQLGMTGTKFGCGIGMCGACTIHFAGTAVRSCTLPVAGAVGIPITTIEGLDSPVQGAWIAEQVPQCGYCQSGQIMAAAAMLAQNPRPTDADIDAQMTNLCRCATYDRIRKGIKAAAATIPLPPTPEPSLEPAPEPVPEEQPTESGEASQ
ncbi:MAG: (2Fe-2S)-binding protein [Deltaproteobacteria bacterium]|nr:(2Fe-2S)-binding protein [Deltaproteobacteria bacterium]